MDIIILGAGAIGSLFGVMLSKNNDVLLIAREKHVDLINKQGLVVEGELQGCFRVKAKTKIEKEDIKENTLIIVTTKAYDVKKSLEEIKGLVRKDTIILLLQNGLGVKEEAKNVLDNCKLISGITYIGGIFLEPGKVKANIGFPTFLENVERSDVVKNVFNNSKLDCKIREDFKKEMWKKLLLNAVLNPLGAITKLNNNELKGKLDYVKEAIVEECILVARKEGIKLDKKRFLELLYDVAEKSRNKASMLQDVLKHKKTEINYINGAVVKLAAKYRIKVPINKAIVEIIKNIEKGD